MADYIVEITDAKDVSFKISLSFIPIGSQPGFWRAKADGFIRYNSGRSSAAKSSGRLTTRDVYLESSDGTWGIRFNEFYNWAGAHDEGSGVLEQAWALAITPGKISWKVIN